MTIAVRRVSKCGEGHRPGRQAENKAQILCDAALPAPQQERRPWWGGDRAASMRRLPSDTAALSAEPAESGQLGLSRSERPAAERAGALVDSPASCPCSAHVWCRFKTMCHGIQIGNAAVQYAYVLCHCLTGSVAVALQDCSARCLGALMD